MIFDDSYNADADNERDPEHFYGAAPMTLPIELERSARARLLLSLAVGPYLMQMAATDVISVASVKSTDPVNQTVDFESDEDCHVCNSTMVHRVRTSIPFSHGSTTFQGVDDAVSKMRAALAKFEAVK